MPMEGNAYRLNEYRITDFGSGLLRWESHFDFGVQQEGRCYRWGDVLVIGEYEREKTGYLKGEFLDQLKKLPAWTGTRYFCLGSQLREVGSGRIPDKNWLEQTMVRPGIPITGEAQKEDQKPGLFRLGQYRIQVTPGEEIHWEAVVEGNKIVSGDCSLVSEILILGPQKTLRGEQTRREFFKHLGGLPQWKGSKTWGRHSALKPSQQLVKSGASPFPGHPPPVQSARVSERKAVSALKDAAVPSPKEFRRRGVETWRAATSCVNSRLKPGLQAVFRKTAAWISGLKISAIPVRLPGRTRQGRIRNGSDPDRMKSYDWLLWLVFLGAGIVLALLGTALYLVNEEEHWFPRYGPTHHRNHNH